MTIREFWKSATPAERDARVHESVFGWERIEDRGIIPRDELPSPERQSSIWSGPTSPYANQLSIPGYTADWAGAGLVIEKMRERGFWLHLEANGSLANNEYCVHYVKGRAWPGHVAAGPEAICLAALLAVEGEE